MTGGVGYLLGFLDGLLQSGVGCSGLQIFQGYGLMLLSYGLDACYCLYVVVANEEGESVGQF